MNLASPGWFVRPERAGGNSGWERAPRSRGKRFTALTRLWRTGKQRPMSDVVSSLANRLPDLAILAVSAIAFAIFGGGIALAINKLWFQCWPKHSAFEDKLADTAHTSLIGLAALVLALMITNGFASLSKTEEVVRQEGVDIYRLGASSTHSAPTPATPARR